MFSLPFFTVHIAREYHSLYRFGKRTARKPQDDDDARIVMLKNHYQQANWALFMSVQCHHRFPVSPHPLPAADLGAFFQLLAPPENH